jgi:hypothetical protein
MKLRIGCLAVVLLSLTLSTRAAATCSPAMLKGAYAAANIGYVGGSPGYGVTLFLESYDGVSNVTGSGVENVNGTVSTGVTLNGTYSVSPDCAFTLSSTDSLGNTINISGSIISSGGQISGISTTSGTQLQFTAYKQHTAICTGSKAGNYVSESLGEYTPYGYEIATSQEKVTAKGTYSGSYVANFSATPASGTFTGSQTVNSDCTYISTTTYSTGGTEDRFGIAGDLENGVHALSIVTDSGSVVLTTVY